MKDRKLLRNLSIIPVLRLEPPGMFEEGVEIPDDRDSIRQLFRGAVASSEIARLEFVPGSDLLLSIESLMPYLEDLARIASHDVVSIGDGELEGGYAFLESGTYLFGAEPGSTFRDTLEWDKAPERLQNDGQATILFACDDFARGKLRKDLVLLDLERTKSEYSILFQLFKDEMERASRLLREFAVSFTPIYSACLARENLSLKNPSEVAKYNFNNRTDWV